MANRVLSSVLILLTALGLWLAVALVPVEWSLSPSHREGAVFRLGPVSSDVPAGQTFDTAELFDLLATPIRVGGPFGSVVQTRIRVHSEGPDGSLVATSAPVEAVSTERTFEMVMFRLSAPVASGRTYYFELDFPQNTAWPVFLAATLRNKDSSGRLFMGGEPGFADQDLVFQLLRRQSLLGRLPHWWTAHHGGVVVAVALVLLLHLASYAAVYALPLELRRLLPHTAVLGLTPPAILAAAYFALMFFVL